MFDQYDQVVNFLQNRRQYGVKPGLGRIKQLLYLLGEPQNDINAIHVAGTNGKGSTVNYLQQALIADGLNVGVFQSPSLSGYTGYIMRNSADITDITFVQYANRIYAAVKMLDTQDEHPTEFEIITAMAFLYFAEKTDIALVEAGMGGRDDTTNCLCPVLSIITNVSRDHTAFLGGSLEAIAWHKAGIIKNNRPVIAGEMTQQVRTVIEQEAQNKDAPLYVAGESFYYQLTASNAAKQTFHWWFGSCCHKDITLPTAGTYQVNNASIALMALELLQRHDFLTDLRGSIAGLMKAHIPGRMEQIMTNPPLILDGAHNAAGAYALTNILEQHFKGANKHLIFAAFYDKDLKRMLEALAPYFVSMTLTTFDHPRAASLEQLQHNNDHLNVSFVSDWRQAIKNGLDHRRNDYCFITGSINFIGSVRQYFRNDIDC